MISFPHAKINLGLNIVEKRSDGFHTIETVFYPVPFTDVLEVLPSSRFFFQSTGIETGSDPENNLAVKAYRLLQKDHNLPPVRIHLHKVIPPGAGLGGGSSDAAFMLKMVNELFSLSLSQSRLEENALLLGSDCPFFITGQPAFATGKGEQMTPLAVNIHHLKIILVKPPANVSTAFAYQSVKPRKPEIPLTEAIQQPAGFWKKTVFNDFEETIFPIHPEIGAIKQKLYDLGAVYASMSGSGSAVFGLFEDFPPELVNHFPGSRVIFPHHL